MLQMQWNDLIGARVGPYTIIDELGRGGSARVFRASQDAPRRQVAIKIMVNDADDPLTFVRRFEREVELVARLTHPNVVAVYDSGQHQDLIYLVMQCVNGGTLRQRFGHPLPIDDACAAMIQMGHALHHAHQHGIVHRDVKPSNMLVAEDEGGQILLTDFGIAKLRGMRGLTKSGTTIGTPEYMAPEQAEGREVDPRADVYSLGCVLYEALAGRPPFVGTSPVSVLYQQVHSRPDYIRGLNPDVPRQLAHIIEIALAKRPEDRFVSAESFARALEPYATHPPRFTTPRPSTVQSQPTDPPAFDELPATESDFATPARDAAAQVFGKRVYLDAPTAALASQAATPAAPEPDWKSAGLDDLFPEEPTLPLATDPAAAGSLDGAVVASSMMRAVRQGTQADLAARAQVMSGPVAGPRPTMPLPSVRAPRGAPSAPRVERPHRDSGRLPELPANVAAAAAALVSSPAAPVIDAPPASSPPSRQPNRPVSAPPAPRRPGRRRIRLMAAAALVILAIGGLVAVLSHANILTGIASRPPARATSVPATATTATSPTPTTQPATTASPTQQQVLDQQAAAAFRSITLSPVSDLSCSSSNAKTSFNTAQNVYVNLCLTTSAPYGHITIVLRQNGTPAFVVTRDYQVFPGHAYWFSIYTYNDKPGTYDVLVTFNAGTAADQTISLQ